MSKIRLFGDSSGFTEIAAADAAGSATVTLPTSAGEILLTDGSAASLTQIPAANIVGVCTSGFARTGGFGLYDGYAVIEDAKTHGTAPQATVGTTWTTKELTRIHINPQSFVTDLSSNQFTLAAGTYVIRWDCVIHRTDTVTTRLYDVTNATTKKVSMVDFSQDNANYGSAHSKGVCRLTIASATVYKIEYFASSGNSNGLTSDDHSGNTEEEIYSTVEVYRESS